MPEAMLQFPACDVYDCTCLQAGIACWLECQTCRRKVASSSPSRSSGRIFLFRVNFVCWLLFSVHSTPMLLQWHVKEPGHSAKSAGGKLHLNTHTPLTQGSLSGLTMPLCRSAWSGCRIWHARSYNIATTAWDDLQCLQYSPWLVASYLSERFQSVIVVSACRPLVHGVPQDSVLGPVLFTLYSQPLSDVISVHDCDYHNKYADDTELSKGASPDQFDSVQSCIQTCIGDVLNWANNNKLMLNTNKTEVMPVGSASRVALVESECTNIGGNSVPFKMSVKYLGVHLDQTLSVLQHIDSVCRASFLELRWATTIGPYLSQSATARLVAAIIISRLDYCNSVFTGLPADQVAELQWIQNTAAQLVMKKRKWDHVTPLLKELHWLPVKFRCRYEIATLAYRHFEGSLPPYLSSSLCTYEPPRSLRSSREKLLKIFRGTFV